MNRLSQWVRPLRRGGVLLGLGLLAACGSGDTGRDVDAGTWQQILAVGQQTFQPSGPPPQAPPLSRAILAGFDAPLIRITNLTEGSSATLLPIAAKGPAGNRTLTWSGVSPVTFTTQGGLLAATRGTGPDLMSSDLRGVRRALAAGGGTYERSHVILVGNTEGITLSFTCRLDNAGAETVTIVERSFATTRFTETCSGPPGQFRSDYWRDGRDGTLWLSRQWAGPDIGHLQIERVIK